MLRKLINMVFFNEKKHFKERFNNLLEAHHKLHEERRRLADENRMLEQTANNIRQILEKSNNREIVIGQTKKGFPTLMTILISGNSDLDILVYNYQESIFWKINMMCSLRVDQIRIHDIQGTDDSKGYGEVAMLQLIEIANKMGIKSISGKISDVDINETHHKDRLNAFYKKFDFEVNFTRMSLYKEMNLTN